MPAKNPLCLFRYSYLDFASHIRYSFTVGVPQMMFLEIENQANRNVEKIILESLSDGEKKRLKEMLGIKVSLDAFRVLPVAPHQGDLIGLESFNGDDGKRFWIYPKETVKL
jgi:hypothetical protein